MPNAQEIQYAPITLGSSSILITRTMIPASAAGASQTLQERTRQHHPIVSTTELSFVMAGHSRSKNGVASLAYVPAVHVFPWGSAVKTWMPGT